jgi:serine/threonine-protein kinase
MPPEQAAGNLEQPGPSSDIYALGVMLFEIVSGDIPLAGKDLATMLAKIRRGELPSLREKQSAAP